MEESSHGKLVEALKVEAGDEEKEVVLEDYSAVESVKDIIDDGNSVPVNETPGDGEDSSSTSSSSDEEEAEEEQGERSSQVENSENIKEEKLVSDVEENVSPSLDETDAEAPILTESLINGLEEETQEQLSSSETTAEYSVLTDVESKGINEETTPPCLDETTNDSMLAEDVVSGAINETTCLAENGGLATKIADSDNDYGVSLRSPNLASKENVEDALQAANVPPTIETRDAGKLVNMPQTRESTGNQVNNPIISLRHHPVQPTSWKGCCGLFEVLRRSNR